MSEPFALECVICGFDCYLEYRYYLTAGSIVCEMCKDNLHRIDHDDDEINERTQKRIAEAERLERYRQQRIADKMSRYITTGKL